MPTAILGFAVIPGMQTRVLTTASSAPTLAMAVNASAYQPAVAPGAWLGGHTADGPGLRAIHLLAATITTLGIAISTHAHHQGRPRTRTPEPANTP
ncbi:hypothetical protein B4N89_31065 [Embleya scabrispora]|uniref:Major facilitator superfamily (MFS) profile domain-containing protein n=1 Tax=Embleya scabrispora TaxID=159449 RepID=A0A1T3NPJ0_9ACTN|nr:hypothetical protein B4N89_31065 [Embleya scabrispora]